MPDFSKNTALKILHLYQNKLTGELYEILTEVQPSKFNCALGLRDSLFEEQLPALLEDAIDFEKCILQFLFLRTD